MRSQSVLVGMVLWEGEAQGSKSRFSLLSEPISPSSLNVYLTFSPSFLLFPPISPSSQLFLGPFLPPPYSVPPPSCGRTCVENVHMQALIPSWCGILVYNDETSNVTSKELARKLAMVRSLLRKSLITHSTHSAKNTVLRNISHDFSVFPLANSVLARQLFFSIWCSW